MSKIDTSVLRTNIAFPILAGMELFRHVRNNRAQVANPVNCSDITCRPAMLRTISPGTMPAPTLCLINDPIPQNRDKRQTKYPSWVGSEHRNIAHIPIQISITRGEADRVLTQPAADRSIVPAVEVVLELRVLVERPGGEEEQRIHRRARLRRQPAEGVIHQVVDHGGRVRLRVVLRGAGRHVEAVDHVMWQQLFMRRANSSVGRETSITSQSQSTPL